MKTGIERLLSWWDKRELSDNPELPPTLPEVYYEAKRFRDLEANHIGQLLGALDAAVIVLKALDRENKYKDTIAMLEAVKGESK